MTQKELNRAVARATGENLRTVARRGFTLADPLVVRYDPEPYDRGAFDPEARIVDWDALEARRRGVLG